MDIASPLRVVLPGSAGIRIPSQEQPRGPAPTPSLQGNYYQEPAQESE